VVHFLLNTPELSKLQVPVIGKGDFAVTWLIKNVRFNDALPAPLASDPASPGTFLSLADSLTQYLTETTHILGGMPIAVTVPVPGPSLPGAYLPTTAVGVDITTISQTINPGTINVSPNQAPALPVATPPNQTAVPPLTPNNFAANDVLSGVPGMLGQVGGSIPVLMNLPLTLTVTWKVQYGSQLPTPEGDAPDFEFVDLVEGTDFLAPNGLVGTALDLIFAPRFKEYDGTDTSTTIFVSAIVTLHAGPESVTVAPSTYSLVSQLRLPVTLLDAGIPRVAAMFRHTNFATQSGGDSGFVFVMVPGGYGFQTFNELAPLLTHLQTTLGNLGSLVHIAGFLTGLGDLLAAVPAQPDIQFRAADKVDDLEDIVFEEGGITDLGIDYDADDEISSIIFLGINGRVFDLFGDSGCQAGHHEIVLTTGSEMWAALPSFSFHNLNEAQQMVQPASASVYVTGPAEDTWNDTTSSVCFDANAGNQ